MRNPFESLYQLASATKNFLYENKVFKTYDVIPSVISVGNLSFGGTGKTPCIEFLATELASAFKVAVICRSYRASAKAPSRVDLKLLNCTKVFGDEACLLQSKLPQCRVWSGPQKFKTALAAQVDKPDILLIDDGFSHRKLMKDFDLVLIDASRAEAEYLRESYQSLKRAHAILLTKVHLSSSDKVEQLKSKILKNAQHLERAIFQARSETILDVAVGAPLFVFCGIAKPESLRASLVQLGFDVKNLVAYADHFAYSDAEQEGLYQNFLRLRNEFPKLALVTTEKDFIKLNHSKLLKDVNVTKHKMVLDDTNKVGLLEKIRANL